MAEDDTTLEVKGLDKLIKALKVNVPVARVGILGDKSTRNKSEQGTTQKSAAPTNAEIGAAHEFGTTTLPQRSFLRVPLTENLNKELEKSGATDRRVMDEVIKSGSLIPYMKKVALVAEGIVLKAFDTGGFGKWEPSDMTRKKVQQTLVETQQLRNSITSEVKG